MKRAWCARWFAAAVVASLHGPHVYASPDGPPVLVAEPLPSVQYEAPTGGGLSISHTDVRFDHDHGLAIGVGSPVRRYSSVSYDSAVSRYGPNSWKRP